MVQKRQIKIVIFVALLCLTLLWVANRSNVKKTQLNVEESASQELSNQANSDEPALLIRDASLNRKLAERFRLTVDYIEKGQDERAIAELNEIIRAQPTAIEPYINLASIYARSSQIDQASETLITAIDVNKNTATLFHSLQKIYAAQAALAYQRALAIDVVNDQDLAVTLPLIDTLMVDQPNITEQDLIANNEDLQKKLGDNVIELNHLRQNLAQALKEKNELVESLNQQAESSGSVLSEIGSDTLASNTLAFSSQDDQSQLEVGELKKQHEQQINELKTQFDMEVLALKRQLDLQTAMLAEVELNSKEPSLVEPSLSVDEVLDVKQPEVVTLVSTEFSDDGVGEQDSIAAIELVKEWARSWASQDVDTYVSYYADNFRPSSGLSYEKWRQQRQTQLTNKSFIEIVVSDFVVEQRGEQFAVTFSQHYKSNDIDNTITKRLVFKKKARDWSQAKIVKESLVSS